jgi:hypothetical protein
MSNLKKTTAFFLALMVLFVGTLTFSVMAEEAGAADTEAVLETEADPVSQTEADPGAADMPLTEYWSADSPVAQSLRSYVEKVTNENDPENFIPVEDRIAVFDMDGTLTCETFFTYYDTMMFIDYCSLLHIA